MERCLHVVFVVFCGKDGSLSCSWRVSGWCIDLHFSQLSHSIMVGMLLRNVHGPWLRVGGLSWTGFSEVGCERNNANCSAFPLSFDFWLGWGTTSCLLLSGERGTAGNIQAPKHCKSCIKENKKEMKRIKTAAACLLNGTWLGSSVSITFGEDVARS